MNKIENKYKVVIGLGKTGFSCVRYLLEQGYDVAVIDSREQPPFLLQLPQLQQQYPHKKLTVSLGAFSSPQTQSLLHQTDELIISPGVALKEPALASCLARGVSVISDIELFARAATAPIIAITGANGKSTVTTLVGEMAREAGLKVQVGGNLGTPALDLLTTNAELYVLELSSFQLETTYSLSAAAATVLNITPDHMDRYNDLAAYCQAKWRIYNGCKVAVINRDDPLSYAADKLPLTTRIISFGMNEPIAGREKEAFGVMGNYLVYAKNNLLLINDIKIKGRHQVANVLAALALGHAIKLPWDSIITAVKNFKGLPHRCQWVRQTSDQVVWYNDSKGTNVGATIAAVEGLGADIAEHGKLILIAGGLGKDANFTSLYDSVSKYVKVIILMGKDGVIIEQALQGCQTVTIKHATSMHDAVIMAASAAKSGDAVLLSPACASFDMFKSFEHRGEVFMDEVNKL